MRRASGLKLGLKRQVAEVDKISVNLATHSPGKRFDSNFSPDVVGLRSVATVGHSLNSRLWFDHTFLVGAVRFVQIGSLAQLVEQRTLNP